VAGDTASHMNTGTRRQATVPAVPSTPAQHRRYQRILAAAVAMLATGGEDLVRMKELAQRADVSLATLYRYFPSKDHVLLAIARDRFETALRRVAAETPNGATAQERVTNHLLREFRAEQRDPKLTAILTKALTDTRLDYRPIVVQVVELHVSVLRQVAVGDRPLSREQRRRLLITIEVFSAATRRWLAGVSSAAEARFEIRMGCHLLNAPGLFLGQEPESKTAAAHSTGR
jgi:TetR/AcrR family transcriptional regulator, cholesterol catabolism regulator